MITLEILLPGRDPTPLRLDSSGSAYTNLAMAPMLPSRQHTLSVCLPADHNSFPLAHFSIGFGFPDPIQPTISLLRAAFTATT
ncbi:MAG TPA: hypothetical protein VMH81_26050, partial [Bryobacteraceae bacterium]|nr:hypothetical protein [Bryobacteraceae bacterium]